MAFKMKDGTGLYKIEKKKNSAFPSHGGKHTSTVDKVKSLGKAIIENVGKVNKRGGGNSIVHKISRSYRQNKKEYRDQYK